MQEIMQIELQIIKSGVKDLVHLLHHVVTIILFDVDTW